ncbi:MAG TPA: RiPP maturation radical SAM C-methyltransferase [Thermoanaerobaculia bacterium]|nr:RiPP maturation radical SAM C-methyltransferase [Thermoanaerobaculia bacterium]
MERLRIALVNMPFSAIELPSIALTQLRSVVERRFGGSVAVEIHYFSHDLCLYLGLDLYRTICDEASHSGLGDWLFRDLAFPGLPDNTEAYRRRFFPARERRQEALELALARRPGLGSLLDELIDRHRLGQAAVVGFTSMFSQNLSSFALARKLKQRRPGLITALGGANAEASMGAEITRHVEAIDYVFSGPALHSFPHLVECCLAGDLAPAERLNGVFTKGNCRGGQPSVAILGDELDIEEEVELNYGSFLDDFERNLREEAVEPILLFETSRGCWWGERAHCTFCGLNGSTMKYRAMRPDRAVALIERLLEHVPRVRRFSCVDNIMPVDYPREVFSRLATPLGASIFYEVKADLDEEDLRWLARAGVDSVQPGIEALSTSTLKLMRKGTTSVRNVQFLKLCRTCGVFPAWNLLVGFPGEGEEVFAKYVEDIPRLVHLAPPSGVYPVRFDRFSPYFVQSAQYGLDLRPLDLYPFTYPLDDASLANLAYYFADRNVTASYFVAMAKWIGRLRRAQTGWRERWAGCEPPALHFEREGGTTVYDSRSGDVVVHEVGEAGRLVLTALEEPAALSDLPARLEGMAAAGIEVELAALRSRGLIFEDGQRLVSLVLLTDKLPGRARAAQPDLAEVPA